MLAGSTSSMVAASGIVGPKGRHLVPVLATIFIFVWTMNVSGMVPLGFAATATINVTAALALCVFFYVQYSALKYHGPGGYLHHLAGEPRDAITWAMVPLMLPLHLIGELAKPFSLAVRLFGNIMGEDTLVAVFVTLGVVVLAFLPEAVPLGVPFHIPFVFLGLLLSTIQALVFMLLSSIYFVLILPHGDDHH